MKSKGVLPVEKPKTTRELLKKIPNYPCLYKHELNDTYYGIKKFNGKIIAHSLKTTERRTAERKLREWIESLEKPEVFNAHDERTLTDVFKMLEKRKGDKKKNTLLGFDFINKALIKFGGNLMIKPLINISENDLAVLLVKLREHYSASSHNKVTALLDELFKIAKKNKFIEENIFEDFENKFVKNPRKKVYAPTIEQCEAIVSDIRFNELLSNAEDKADFAEFLHLAAIGEAEAINLKWGDFDFKKQLINLTRIKTSREYSIPIYEYLKPLIAKLHKKTGGNPDPKQLVFSDSVFSTSNKMHRAKGKVRAKKSVGHDIYNSCKNLGYKRYSPVDFRRARITWMYKRGIPPKVIADWQGHNDGGKLIMERYSHVLDDDNADYIKEQLKKLE